MLLTLQLFVALSPNNRSKRIRLSPSVDADSAGSGRSSVSKTPDLIGATSSSSPDHGTVPPMTSAFSRCATSLHSSTGIVAQSRPSLSKLCGQLSTDGSCCACSKNLKALQETYNELKQAHDQLLRKARSNSVEAPPGTVDYLCKLYRTIKCLYFFLSYICLIHKVIHESSSHSCPLLLCWV